jgi:predicted AlkP superfamily pyrophosphatase or phosphodiesterase
MTSIRWLSIAIIILCLTASRTALASELVIVLSWDGFRHDYLDVADFPALQRMADNGVRSKLIPGYPSDTFPGHLMMATGADISVHGIVSNKFIDRDSGYHAYSNDASLIRAEPLWVTTERQGKKAAVYFWPGSETDWQGTAATYRMAPFDNDRAESDKVTKILEWIDLPADKRPSLIMSYWRGADTEAHIKGPFHADVIASLQVQDRQLGRLIDALEQRGLWQQTTLFIVADHGMSEVNNNILVSEALENAAIPAQVVGGSSMKRVFLDEPEQLPAALATLRGMKDIEVFTGDDIPPTLRHPGRTGDILVTTRPPNVLDIDNSFPARFRRLIMPIMGWGTGAHGYHPSDPDMAATFLAMGAGVSADRELESVHQKQLAPTVAALLGIAPPMSASEPPLILTSETR